MTIENRNKSNAEAARKEPVKFQTQQDNPDYFGVIDIDPNEVASLSHAVHLIDVRQPAEFTGELGHAPGAKLIVLDSLPERMDELPKDEPIVLLCRSGARSARAAAFMKENGFQFVYNMKGGMLLWNSLGLKAER